MKEQVTDINCPALPRQTRLWTMLPTTALTVVSLLQMRSMYLTM